MHEWILDPSLPRESARCWSECGEPTGPAPKASRLGRIVTVVGLEPNGHSRLLSGLPWRDAGRCSQVRTDDPVLAPEAVWPKRVSRLVGGGKASRPDRAAAIGQVVRGHAGEGRLAELTTPEVDRWLMERSKNLGSDMLRRIHSCLNRSVKRAVARDLVARNVVSLATVPPGRGGRASKSLTTSQVDQILAQVPPGRMRAYIVLSLLTGARTEELRALSWEHVHLEAEKVGTELVPPHIEVWRSVRRGGDTKTRSSRRTLALPDLCVSVLRERWAEYADDRDRAADRWVENDLVFTTRIGHLSPPITCAGTSGWRSEASRGSIRLTGPLAN